MATKGAILISGASKGIGAACALRLERAGFHVFAGVRKEADGEELSRRASSRLEPIILDVADGDSIARAAEVVRARVGEAGLKGLVNNAGIVVASPMEIVPMDRFRQQMDVNLFGPVAMCQTFLPLIRQGKGRVVNMGSIGGKQAFPLMGPYSMSKFAMEAFSDTLRMELKPWGIHVALIEPGSVATPIWNTSLESAVKMMEGMPPEGLTLYRQIIDAMMKVSAGAGERGMPPDKVAQAVEHALTAKRPKSRYVVGIDARVQFLLSHLPDQMEDSLILSQLER